MKSRRSWRSPMPSRSASALDVGVVAVERAFGDQRRAPATRCSTCRARRPRSGDDSGRQRRHGRKPASCAAAARRVEVDVLELRRARRADRPAVDPGRAHADEEAPVEARVARAERAIAGRRGPESSSWADYATRARPKSRRFRTRMARAPGVLSRKAEGSTAPRHAHRDWSLRSVHVARRHGPLPSAVRPARRRGHVRRREGGAGHRRFRLPHGHRSGVLRRPALPRHPARRRRHHHGHARAAPPDRAVDRAGAPDDDVDDLRLHGLAAAGRRRHSEGRRSDDPLGRARRARTARRDPRPRAGRDSAGRSSPAPA